MRNVPTIDASGLHSLEELAKEAASSGYILVFSAVSKSVFAAMASSGFVATVRADRFAPDIFAALEIAREHLAQPEVI